MDRREHGQSHGNDGDVSPRSKNDADGEGRP